MKKHIEFSLLSLMSGISLGISGTAFLLCLNYFPIYGKIIGAFIFSMGIYFIIMYGMKLFTGMVSKIPDMKIREYWKLILCFIFNTVGIIFTAYIVSKTSLSEIVINESISIIEKKMSAESLYITALCSSILCGALITFSVWSPKLAKEKNISATLGVVLPIAVFVLCGFDHSVANMLYFTFNGEISLTILTYMGITILGNTIGGIILPLIYKFKNIKE